MPLNKTIFFMQAAYLIPSLNEFAAPTVREKLKGCLPKKGDVVFKVVLPSGRMSATAVVTQLGKYLETLGIDRALGRRFNAGVGVPSSPLLL